MGEGQYSGIWKSGKRRRRDGGRRRRGGGECVDKRGIEGDGNKEKDVRKEEYYKQTQYVPNTCTILYISHTFVARPALHVATLISLRDSWLSLKSNYFPRAYTFYTNDKVRLHNE